MLKEFFSNIFQKSIITRIDNHSIPKNVPWSPSTTNKGELIFENQNWAAIAANFNATAVSSTPLRVYAWNRGERTLRGIDHRRLESKEISLIRKNRPIIRQNDTVVELFNHPINYLLERPNAHMSQFDMLELTQKYLDFTGNSYLKIEYDNDIPSELYMMNSALTNVVVGERKLIKGYLYGKNRHTWDYSNNTGIVALKEKDVLRFHVPSLESAIYGASVVEQHLGAINRDKLYDIYENSGLKNHARPDFVVKYNKKLDQKTLKQLNLEWNKMYKGGSKSGQVKVMDTDFEIEKLSFSPKDMEFLQGRRITVRQICLAFGIPYALLDSESQLKAGLDQVLPLWQSYAILPRLRRIEGVLNEQLCYKFDPTGKLFVQFDNPVQEDQRFKLLQSSSLYKSGIIDRNEAREMVGLSAVENGETNEREI